MLSILNPFFIFVQIIYKMKVKLLIVVFCFASFFVNGQTKVGTINSEFIVGLMPESKQVLSELKTYAAKLDSTYQVKLADYNAKVTAFQKLDPSLSENFKKVKIEEINELEQYIYLKTYLFYHNNIIYDRINNVNYTNNIIN